MGVFSNEVSPEITKNRDPWQAGRAGYGGEISYEGSNPGKDVTKSIDY